MSFDFRGCEDSRAEPPVPLARTFPRRRSARLPAALLSLLLSLLILPVAASAGDQDTDKTDKPDKAAKTKKPEKPAPHHSKPDKVLHGADARRPLDPVVTFINHQIRQSWQDNQIVQSPIADDEEWLRRVSLDLFGHIPFWKDVDHFRKDKSPNKRAALIDKMLDDPAYVRNFTTIWTNLTIGRQTPRLVSRGGIQKFFREAFAQSRPWNEIVYDLVSAEGRSDENGAVNYLLAQMATRDEMVLATSKTTRLFMGLQLQCAQCHNHPFDPWKQAQFWELNSFLRQTRPVEHRRFDRATGQRVTDYTELVRSDFSGPVYYEKRSGEMQVAYPIFFDKKVDPGSEIDRRKELARLMTSGDKPYIAQAFVNRTWGHFFGYGFSNPVDDIGARHPPSHPELLERLSEEFVKNRYDVKRLIRWICDSEAYQLTSRTTVKNAKDDPSLGHAPLFSRVYPKPMEAEQLYDSLLIATDADRAVHADWAARQKQRDEWLQQFIIAFGTDENDEATTFNGTIPQALLMMNGQLIEKATSGESGSFLHNVLDSENTDSQKVARLYLAALSRHPRGHEMGAAEHLLDLYPDKLAGYQDLFWALLNSNEFIINH
jgi:Protein of unknown function (DUF1549)/Protein of unknown function (DUF1553)